MLSLPEHTEVELMQTAGELSVLTEPDRTSAGKEEDPAVSLSVCARGRGRGDGEGDGAMKEIMCQREERKQREGAREGGREREMLPVGLLS